jgi:excisionase family DNA binding protein
MQSMQDMRGEADVDELEIPEAVLKVARVLVANGIDLTPAPEAEPHDAAPESYKVSEIAKALKVAESTVYRWISKGRLPAMRLGDEGRAIRVSAEDFEAFKRRGLMRAVQHSTKVSEVAS